MAATSRTRAIGNRASASNIRGRTTLAGRIAAFRRSARASLPEIAGTARFRRELLGVLLVLLALLSAYVIGRGGDEGRLVAWWGSSLDRSLGRAAFLVPVLIGLAALRAFGGQSGRVLEGRHYLGGFAFAVAVVGLLQLGGRSGSDLMGGALGSSVATLSIRILGPFGAGLALFAVGVLAIFLLAGSDFQTFCNDVRALLEATWRAISALIDAAAAVETKIRRFEYRCDRGVTVKLWLRRSRLLSLLRTASHAESRPRFMPLLSRNNPLKSSWPRSSTCHRAHRPRSHF